MKKIVWKNINLIFWWTEYKKEQIKDYDEKYQWKKKKTLSERKEKL